MFVINLCCSVIICVVQLLFKLFYVLYVCKWVLNHCHRVFTQLQLANISYHIISYHISYHIISYHIKMHGLMNIKKRWNSTYIYKFQQILMSKKVFFFLYNSATSYSYRKSTSQKYFAIKLCSIINKEFYMVLFFIYFRIESLRNNRF
jgi:hypothetical protein